MSDALENSSLVRLQPREAELWRPAEWVDILLPVVNFLRAVIPRFPDHQANCAGARMALVPVLAAAAAKFEQAQPVSPRRGELEISLKALKTCGLLFQTTPECISCCHLLVLC